jgi:hypothetical protein
VDAKRVAQIMDSHVVQLGRLAALPKHLLRLPVGERVREYRIGRGAGVGHPVGGEEPYQRVWEWHLAGGARGLEASGAALDSEPPLSESHITPAEGGPAVLSDHLAQPETGVGHQGEERAPGGRDSIEERSQLIGRQPPLPAGGLLLVPVGRSAHVHFALVRN